MGSAVSQNVTRLEDSILRSSKRQGGNGIDALVRGSSTRLISSLRLEWQSVCVECHDAFPAERAESISGDHVAALFTDRVSRGESSIAAGRFAPYSYRPGTINLFPAGPIPACRPSTNTRMIICALDPTFLNKVSEEADVSLAESFCRRTTLRDQALESIIMLLAAEASSGGLSGKLYAEHLTHALALRILWPGAETQRVSLPHCTTMPNRALRRVLERMEEEIDANLDLHTLAAESGYSRAHFLRMFRASMGCSPHQWLTRSRIERAQTMLRQRAVPLIDIAAACGFSSHAHLCKAFRQIVGVTPSFYRRTPDLFM